MSKSVVVVPDGGWGWVIVFVSFTFHFLVGFMYAAQSILYIALQDHFEEGKGLTSWILSTFNTSLVIVGPVSASLGVRYGYKNVTFVGGFLMGLGVFVCYFARSVIYIIIAIGVVAGIGAGLCYVPVVAMCALYFDKKRSLAVGLATSGLGVGALSMPPLLSFLEAELTWRGMLLIISGCMFNMCVLALLMRPLTKSNIDFDCQVYENVDKEEEDIETNEKTSLISYDDVDFKVVAVEEIDVSGNEHSMNLIRHDRHEIGTQSLSDITHEVAPSPTDVLSDSTLKVPSQNGIRLNMASEIMRRNKHISIEKDRGRSHSFNQNTSMSSENVNNTKKQQHHFSSVQEIYNKRQHSNLDITKDNHNDHLSEPDGISLTNLSIMLMGSIYNIVTLDSHLNSMFSLNSNKLVLDQESEMDDSKSCYSQRDDSHASPQVDGPTAPSRDINIQRNNRCSALCDVLKVYKDLMTNGRCLLLLIINFLVNLSYLTPVLYIVDRAVENGIDRESAVLSLSLYGAGSICGRILTGAIADCRFINRLVLYFTCIFMCGLVTILSVFCGPHLPLHLVYGFTFGLFIGGYVILTTVVIVDILGIEVVSQSYGLCLMFMSVSTLFGTPMGGFMFDTSGSYKVPFVIYGGYLILSALLLVPLIYQSLREGKREGQSSQDERAPLDSSP